MNRRERNIESLRNEKREKKGKVLEELVDVIAKPRSFISVKAWLSGKVPCDWEKGDIIPIYKKGRPGELQVGKPHVCSLEDHGTNGRDIKTHAKRGDPRQPAQLQIMPDQSSGLLQHSNSITGQGKSKSCQLAGLLQGL